MNGKPHETDVDGLASTDLAEQGVVKRTIVRLKAHLPASVGLAALLFVITAGAQWAIDGADQQAWHQVSGGAFVPSLIAIAVATLMLVSFHVYRAIQDEINALKDRYGRAEARVVSLREARDLMPVGEEHRVRLDALIDACLLALANERVCDFGDTGRQFHREMFKAHFSDLLPEMDRWNHVISRRDSATGAFRARLLTEIDARGLGDAPYVSGIVASMLGDALTRRWEAATEWGKHRLNWNAHDAGESTNLSARMAWWNEFTVATVANDPREDYMQRLDDVMDGVNVFVDDAQEWPEARDMIAAWQAVREFSREKVRDALLEHKLAPMFVATGCLGCGLSEQGAGQAPAA